jgi:hypothetical protein
MNLAPVQRDEPHPDGPEKPVLDAETLGRALRISGSLLVIASASTFMLQQWSDKDDLFRYFMLLAHGVLLAGAAYVCGLTMREGRGARTALALVLAIVPVTFAVLGGLVYSQFHLEAMAPLPRYASWVAPSKAHALGAVVATLAVLAPLTVVACVALARKRARSLALAFLGTNLLLLIPVRDPDVILGLLLATVLVLSRIEVRHFAPVFQLKTTEGRIARAMPFVAPALMAGRVLHLYDPTSLFAGGAILTAGYGIWAMAPRFTTERARESSAWASAFLFIAGWSIAISGLHLAPAELLLAIGLPSSLLVALSARRAGTSARALLGIATAQALITALLAPLLALNTLTAFAALLAGTCVALAGAARQSRFRLFAGGAVGLVGLVLEVVLAARADHVVRWASLSLIGVLLIVGSSYVERHKDALARYFAKRVEREPRLPAAGGGVG